MTGRLTDPSDVLNSFDTSEASFEAPPPIAGHCCEHNRLGGVACTHVPAARVLCPDHGAGLVGVEGASVVDAHPIVPPTDVDTSSNATAPIAPIGVRPVTRTLTSALTLPINHCNGCGEMLTEPGGLLFSPPDVLGRVDKLHLCVDCFDLVVAPFHG
jgi:hypothetical protein